MRDPVRVSSLFEQVCDGCSGALFFEDFVNQRIEAEVASIPGSNGGSIVSVFLMVSISNVESRLAKTTWEATSSYVLEMVRGSCSQD